MAHIIFKDIWLFLKQEPLHPKNNEKNVETSPLGVPLTVAACGKFAKQNQGMTLKKMNERSPKETIKVAGNQKEDASLYQKP